MLEQKVVSVVVTVVIMIIMIQRDNGVAVLENESDRYNFEEHQVRR